MFIVMMLVGIFVATWIAACAWDDNEWFEDGFFVALFVTALLAFPSLIFAYHVGDSHPLHTETGYFNIIASEDSTSVQGSFGLFSGYIDEQWRYYYYTEKEGRITMGWVPVDTTEIIEDVPEGEKARVDVVKSHKDTWSFWGISTYNKTRYEIHVPKGTVVRDHTMDLKK